MYPHELAQLTPREYHNILDGQKLRRVDELEDLAILALMTRKATNAKRVKLTDLLDRKKLESDQKRKVVDLDEKRRTLEELDKELGVM